MSGTSPEAAPLIRERHVVARHSGHSAAVPRVSPFSATLASSSLTARWVSVASRRFLLCGCTCTASHVALCPASPPSLSRFDFAPGVCSLWSLPFRDAGTRCAMGRHMAINSTQTRPLDHKAGQPRVEQICAVQVADQAPSARGGVRPPQCSISESMMTADAIASAASVAAAASRSFAARGRCACTCLSRE